MASCRLRFRNHGNGNNGHIQRGPGGQWRGAAKWKEWRGSVSALPSGEDLTFKNVKNDGAPCETKRGVPLVITTKQMRCGKTGRPSSMPCASAVEASGCESVGWRYKPVPVPEYLAPSVAGWKEGNAVLHWKFWVPAFVPKGLAVGLPGLPNFAISPTGWVGWPSPVLSRAIPPHRRWRGWVGIRPVICQKVVNFISEGGAYGFQKQKKI